MSLSGGSTTRHLAPAHFAPKYLRKGRLCHYYLVSCSWLLFSLACFLFLFGLRPAHETKLKLKRLPFCLPPSAAASVKRKLFEFIFVFYLGFLYLIFTLDRWSVFLRQFFGIGMNRTKRENTTHRYVYQARTDIRAENESFTEWTEWIRRITRARLERCVAAGRATCCWQHSRAGNSSPILLILPSFMDFMKPIVPG